MNYLPIFLDLRDRHCLVVGGSETAARKAELLLRAGARVDIAAPALHAGFERLPHADHLNRVADAFTPGLLDGKDLVIVVEDDAAAARLIADAARARHIPVNVADQPALCSFILPSIIERPPLVIAVSSGWGIPSSGALKFSSSSLRAASSCTVISSACSRRHSASASCIPYTSRACSFANCITERACIFPVAVSEK